MTKPKPKSEVHYHGCTRCRRRFPDACGDSTQTMKAPCPSCRMGRLSVVMTGIEPRPCCETTSRIANKADHKTYRLAGKGPWWLCRVCARQFPTDPRSHP